MKELENIKEVITYAMELLKLKKSVVEEWRRGVKYRKISKNKIKVNIPIGPILGIIEEPKVYEKKTSNENQSNKAYLIKDTKGRTIELENGEGLCDEGLITVVTESNTDDYLKDHIIEIEKEIRKLADIKENISNIPVIQHIAKIYKNDQKKVSHFKSISQKELANSFLNEKQEEVLDVVLKKGCPITFCTGDPGTGKTTTAISLLENLVNQGKSCLVLSESNGNIDTILKELLKRTKHSISPLRIRGTKSKVSPKVYDFCLDNPSEKFLNKIISPLKEHYKHRNHDGRYSELQKHWLNSLEEKELDFPSWYLQCFDALFSTINLAKALPSDSIKERVIIPIPFDYLIIDKAENISFIDFLQISPLGEKVAVFGDIKQKKDTQYKFILSQLNSLKSDKYSSDELIRMYYSYKNGIIFNETNRASISAKKLNHIRTIKKAEELTNITILEMERIFKNTTNGKRQIIKSINLKQNYRNECLREIINIINKKTEARDVTKQKKEIANCNKTSISITFEGIGKISKPLFLIDTKRVKILGDYLRHGTLRKTSFINKKEGELLLKLLKSINPVDNNMVHIAILTPYRAQLEEVLWPKISKEMNIKIPENCSYEFKIKENVIVTIDTFDSFSNEECDIVIVSFCHYNPKTLTEFILNKNRTFNVISRARLMTIFVANGEMLKFILSNVGFNLILDIINNTGSSVELPYNFVE